MKQLLSSVALVLLLNLTAAAQDASVLRKIHLVENSLVGPVKAKDTKGWTLHERMAHYGVNGVSIAVIHNYQLEWAKSYGLANASSKMPVTAQTLFQAGSVSKSLNAVGLLRLVEKGRVSLNTDIDRYLTSWKFSYDSLSKGHVITLAQLLSHTAGVNVAGFSGYRQGQALPNTVQILKGQAPANSSAVGPVRAPGERYEYSGGGTMITQLMVEDVTRQSYAQYMQQQVLQPLGMAASSFATPARNKARLVAHGYYEDGKPVEGQYHLYPEQAAAGLWTTPSDLAKFIIALQQAYRGTSGRVLSPAMAKRMLTPYHDQRSALGVFVGNYNGTRYFEHDGLIYGYYCQYYGSLTGGNGVVVMTNSVNTALIPEIVNSVAQVYGFKGLLRTKTETSLTLAEDVLTSYTGKYQLEPGAVLTVFTENHQLYVQLTGQNKIPLFAETEHKFYLKVVDAQLEFVKDAGGNISKAILYQNGSANDAPRVGPPAP